MTHYGFRLTAEAKTDLERLQAWHIERDLDVADRAVEAIEGTFALLASSAAASLEPRRRVCPDTSTCPLRESGSPHKMTTEAVARPEDTAILEALERRRRD